MSKTLSTDEIWVLLNSLNVLAEEGSFTAAADKLNISKSAMSHRIAGLETTLGVTLVTRTTRSVRFTEAGRSLIDGTHSAFQQISQTISKVRGSAGCPEGVVRVGAVAPFGRSQLLPVLEPFLSQYSNVRVRLELFDHQDDFATEGLELILSHSDNIPETHSGSVLARTFPVLVASPLYLKKRGVPRLPQDLTEFDCLPLSRPGESPTWHFEGSMESGSERVRQSVPINGILSTNNIETLRLAALDDVGIVLVPDFVVEADLRAERLVQILPDWTPVCACPGQLLLLRPHAPNVSAAVNAFTVYVQKAFEHGFTVPIGNRD